MTHSARPFGLSTGGFDRRMVSDRRVEERRKVAVPVPFERRSGLERRSPRGRRITEWFRPRPVLSLHRVTPDVPTPAEDAGPHARDGDDLSGRSETQRSPVEVLTSHVFRHGGRTYDVDWEDTLDERGRTTGRRWLVKVDNVVEHTLRVLPNESRDSLEQRAIHAIEDTGAGAVREIDFTFGGRRYHLEDWSCAVAQGEATDQAMWCVTCDGVIEGSFASASGEAESVLRHRAIEIARRSGENHVIRDVPYRRTPSPRPSPVRDQKRQSGSLRIMVWIVVGVATAGAVSVLVQAVLAATP